MFVYSQNVAQMCRRLNDSMTTNFSTGIANWDLSRTLKLNDNMAEYRRPLSQVKYSLKTQNYISHFIFDNVNESHTNAIVCVDRERLKINAGGPSFVVGGPSLLSAVTPDRLRIMVTVISERLSNYSLSI